MPTTSTSSYRNPDEFPYEAFVQRALTTYFASQGFSVERVKNVDFVCSKPLGDQRWIVEAKGQTANPGLDFRTGLGQLMQAMNDPTAAYGIAVPDTPPFINQCKKVSDWVRQALHVHWILVNTHGIVRIIDPHDQL